MWRKLGGAFEAESHRARRISFIFKSSHRGNNKVMKTLSFLLVVGALLCATTVLADDEAKLNRVLGSLNARANMPDGKIFVVNGVSHDTKVPPQTLMAEQSSTGFGFGELLAAHTIATASGKSFQEVAALRMKQRKNWTQIAQQLNVDIAMVTKKAQHVDTAVDYAYSGRNGRSQDRANMLRNAGMDRPHVVSGDSRAQF
jgi:hypothetical protein